MLQWHIQEKFLLVRETIPQEHYIFLIQSFKFSLKKTKQRFKICLKNTTRKVSTALSVLGSDAGPGIFPSQDFFCTKKKKEFLVQISLLGPICGTFATRWLKMRTATKLYTFHLIQAYQGLIFSFNFYLVLVLQVCLYVSLIFSLVQSFKPKFGLFLCVCI